MDISQLISSKQKSEMFVSFVIGNEWLQAGLWEVIDQEGIFRASGTASPWQEQNPNSFIDAADDSLSSAIGALGHQENLPELSKVVFGLPPLWIENGKVHSDKLGALRELCEKLELTPSGFVVIPEALVYMIRQKEGGAGSFILVGLDEEEIEITVIQAGKVADTQRVARSISLGDDIAEGLTRVNSHEPMPARIILYNRHTHQLSEAKQELVSWEWPTKIFLHTPRVEILESDVLIHSVSQAAAMEVAQVSKFQIQSETTNQTVITQQKELTKPKDEKDLTDAQDLGFVSDEETEKPQTLNPILNDRMDSGFSKKLGSLPEEDNQENTPVQSKFESHQLDEATIEKQPKTFAIPILPKLLRLLPKPKLGSSKMYGITAFILIFLVVFGSTLWYIPRAAVTIYVAPKRIENTIPVLVVAEGQASGKLAGKNITTEVLGEKTTSTSGKKVIGDRAKGEVIIFNNTVSNKTFTAGTILTGPNSLKFILDQDVKVASESGAPTYKPGEAKAALTASAIGAEYNLAPDSIFSLANFTTASFSGRNITPFTGGSSREVAAVDKKDQQQLEHELLQELQEKAIEKLNAQLGTDEILIPESMKTSVISQKFSKKIGDEAENLGLKLNLSVAFLTVSRSSLYEYITSILASQVPPDFILQNDRIDINFNPDLNQKNPKENEHSYTAKVSALLIPQVKINDIAKKISGSTPNGARSTLVNLPGFTRSTIKLTPDLPVLAGMLGRIPKRTQNITVEIKAEE